MMKKLNKKGITLAELIVSFALVSVSVIYFYQTIYTVRKLYKESENRTNFLVEESYNYRITNLIVNKNNGKPYLSGTDPVAADTSLVDELGKYADTITVSANAADGSVLTALRSGETAAADITVAITQSKDDIQKGYLTAENHTLKLLKKK